MEGPSVQLTPAQEEAVTSAGSLCVVAGAGTGKTTVLVRRYLRLLRERLAQVPQIIAITFTEKAAQQMKDAVRKACADQLRDAGDAEGRLFWLQQRNDLDRSQISTIHSLCAQIIRECPVEAGVDPRFSVLDGVESDILLAKVARRSLTGLLEKGDQNAAALVAEFDLSRSVDLIRLAVDQRAVMESCLDGWDLGDEGAVLRRWADALSEAKVSAQQGLLSGTAWKEAVETIRRTEPLADGDKIGAQRSEILKLQSRIEQSAPPDASLFASIREQCNCTGGRKTAWGEGDLARIKEAFKSLRSLLEAETLLALGPVGEGEQKALRMARALVNVSRRVNADYAERKRESGFLDFQDLELIARDLLLKSADVRRRYQSRIRYVLVDEFQDTNPVQKDIVYALSGGGEGKRLFIVGDAKQSIYRFRGADVSVFAKVERDIEAAKGRRITLDTNFRSLPGLVGFFNHVFGRCMAERRADYEAEYSPLEPSQEKRLLPSPGHLVVEIIIPRRERDDRADDLRRREAEMIARRLRRMVDHGEPLVNDKGSYRAVTFGDVAVLFRAISNIWIYEQALRRYSIPYSVVAGSGFYARQEIKDVLNLLRVLDNRMDDLSLAGLLRSPIFAVSDNTLYWLGARRTTPLFERLTGHEQIPQIQPDEREKLRHASETLQALLAARDRVSLPGLLTRALEMTRYDALLLSQFLGKQKALNVYKLIETARKFDRRGIFTLHDFADYVSEFVSSEVREGEAPVSEEAGVTLMTVHKAKGLEFPVVFVADVSRQERQKSKDVYFDAKWGLAIDLLDEDGRRVKTIPSLALAQEERRKEDAESKRLFYVAATRARDCLVLSGWCPAGEEGRQEAPGPWFSALDATFHLRDAGDEVAFQGGRARVLRRVDYEPGTAWGPHKPWADRYSDEIAALRAIPVEVSADEEGLTRRMAQASSPLTAKMRFTPSELLEYQWCPRAYYFERVLALPLKGSEEGRASGARAYARLRGRVAHRALEMMVKGSKPDLGEVLSRVMSEEEFAELGAFPDLGACARRLGGLEGMLARFRESATYQEICRATERHAEFRFLAAFPAHPQGPPGAEGFYLEGTMDVLYLGRAGWEVIDYKTGDVGEDDDLDGAVMSGTSRDEAYEVQTAAYSLAAEQVLGVRPAGVSLYLLGSAERPRRREPVTPEYVEDCRKRIGVLVRDIRAGRFDAGRKDCRCNYEWVCKRAALRTGAKG